MSCDAARFCFVGGLVCFFDLGAFATGFLLALGARSWTLPRVLALALEVVAAVVAVGDAVLVLLTGLVSPLGTGSLAKRSWRAFRAAPRVITPIAYGLLQAVALMRAEMGTLGLGKEEDKSALEGGELDSTSLLRRDAVLCSLALANCVEVFFGLLCHSFGFRLRLASSLLPSRLCCRTTRRLVNAGRLAGRHEFATKGMAF